MSLKLRFLNPVVSERTAGSILDGRVDLCISTSLVEDTGQLSDFRRLDVEVGWLLEAMRLLAAMMFNNG